MRLKNSGRCVTIILIAAGFIAARPVNQSIRPGRSDSMRSAIVSTSCTPFAATRFVKTGGAGSISNTRKYAKKTVSNDPPEISALPSLGPAWLEARKRTVLELIRYPWEDLGYEIVFLNSRPGYRALTFSARHRIEVYVRRGEGPIYQAFDLAHELGHAFDLKYNSEARRREWLELRGVETSTPWFGCDACPDYGTPAGDFAETFALLLLGPGDFHSTLSPQPDAGQIPKLAAFCRIPRVSEVLKISRFQENTPQIFEEFCVPTNPAPTSSPNEL